MKIKSFINFPMFITFDFTELKYIIFKIMNISLVITILFLITLLTILIRQNLMLRKNFEGIASFFTNTINTINSVRYGNLSARVNSYCPEYTMNAADSINRMIETFSDREKMIVEYQSELTKQNNFLNLLINSLYDGIFVLDENYTVLRANKKIYQWLKTENITGLNIFEFIKLPEDKDICDLADDEIFIKGSKDFCFKAHTQKIEAEKRRYIYMMVINNYTAQKEMESLKEDFVATLTHDLKVPIVAEANMLEFFIDEKFGKLNEKQKEALNTMKTSNSQLLDLVRIVLDTYRMKENELELNKENISLKNLLYETADEMKVIAQKTQNNIIILPSYDFNINVDYFQFKRVIKNLVNNAVSYGRENTDIELDYKKNSTDIQITVKDYGKGISKEEANKIFNRYFSASKKFRKIGTGLGLYLSQKIVQAHGGTLTLSSEEGKYTKFCINLPT